METVQLWFDRPPGVNGLYANKPGKGRIKTSAYREWRESAAKQIALQRPGGVRGPFAFWLSSERSTRGADLDGIIKPTLDMLALCGVIQNDNLTQSIEVRWHGRGTEMRVRVTSTREVWDDELASAGLPGSEADQGSFAGDEREDQQFVPRHGLVGPGRREAHVPRMQILGR